MTAREMHAVDSENKRNLQNDSRRLFQLGKSLSIEGHPWRKFSTGNFATLTEAARKEVERGGQALHDGEESEGDGGPVGREARRRLVEWWKQEYCAGRMSLTVVGKGKCLPLLPPEYHV